MTCVDVRERLGAFLDGEDPAPGEVDAHLRGCPSCAAAIEALRGERADLDAALGPVAARAEAGAARALAGLPPDRVAGGIPWWGLPLAAAAGFLFAMTFTRGGNAPPVRPPADRTAQLAAEKARQEREEVAAEVALILRTPEVGCVVESPDQKLRKLGAACVGPAAAWVKQADPEAEKFRRRSAAMAAADMATREHAGLLIEMMDDTDPEVRVYANRGLSRLSGLAGGGDEMARKAAEVVKAAWERAFAVKR